MSGHADVSLYVCVYLCLCVSGHMCRPYVRWCAWCDLGVFICPCIL